MDNRPSSQDGHPLPSEAYGCTLTDCRSLQTPTGRQAGVRQDELLVDVQEIEEGHGSLLSDELAQPWCAAPPIAALRL